MKKFWIALGLLVSLSAQSADVKISQLPLGSAATTSSTDSFPFVASSVNITKRLTLWDLINLPPIVATYAPKASPTFTGTVTAPTFVGALTGNASTATALANNPTDCSTNQYANAIAASGNLTCAQPSFSQLTGTATVAQGGTGLASGTAGGVLAFTGTTTLASSLGGSTGQILRSAGTSAVPTWSTATYPATTTANAILYSSATNTVSEIANGTTGQILTATTGGAPSWGSPAGSLTVAAKTSNYTVTSSDGLLTGDSSGGAFQFTLPAVSSNSGKVYYFKKIDSSTNAITIARAGSDTIDGATSITLTAQYESTVLISNGSALWSIF
jgi:hypothetical protein